MNNVLRVRRGDSPIVATVLLMGITLFAMSFTLSFVQQNMARRDGESDFTLAKTFMKNIGLSIDDVAWHTGQMNTIQYSDQNAEIHLREGLLHYKIEISRDGVNYVEVNETRDSYLSVLLYDIPTSRYSLDNTYFEEIMPSEMIDIVQNSTSAPIVRVFALQTLPRADENYYMSVAVAPLIRSVPFNITTGYGAAQTTSRFMKFYLVNVTMGSLTTANPRYISLTGGEIQTRIIPDVRTVRVTVLFPKEAKGYDYAFFKFPATTQIIDFGASKADVELYFGNVKVGFLK